jgi:hypothetical protein
MSHWRLAYECLIDRIVKRTVLRYRGRAFRRRPVRAGSSSPPFRRFHEPLKRSLVSAKSGLGER